MSRQVRDVGRHIADLLAYGCRTGRWWMPAVAVLLMMIAVLVSVVKVVVPTAMYTLF